MIVVTRSTQKSGSKGVDYIQSTYVPDMARPAEISSEDWQHALRLHQAQVGDNVPIEFYANFTDQYDQPVSGVAVEIVISTYEESLFKQWSSSEACIKTTNCILTSDNNGHVQLTGAKGRHLAVSSITKAGYLPANNNLISIGYAPAFRDGPLPTEKEPFIYRLWKRELVSDDVQTRRKNFRLLADAPLAIDIVTGEKVPPSSEHDILFTMTTETSGAGKNYNWAVTLDTLSGGVVEVTDYDGMYKAPEHGYKNRIVWKMDRDSPEWSPIMTKFAYLKSKDGKIHAALFIYMSSNRTGEGMLSIRYAYNTTGARILEHEERL